MVAVRLQLYLIWHIILQKKKLKTLVIDTDPQLNLTSIIGLNVNQLQSSLGDYLLNRLNTFKPEVINENFHLLSAPFDLSKGII